VQRLFPGDMAFVGWVGKGSSISPAFPVWPGAELDSSDSPLFALRGGELLTVVGVSADNWERVYVLAHQRLGWMWSGHLLRLTPELAERADQESGRP